MMAVEKWHGQPTLESKALFYGQGRWSLYGFGVLSTVILLAGNIAFLTAHPSFLAFGLVVAVTAIYLSMSYAVGFLGKDFDLLRHRELVAKWLDRSVSASVDIFYPVCGEPRGMVENTMVHLQALAVNHPNAKVFVLDDKSDPAVERLAKGYGFAYITREGNELKKAGNLRNAFRQTSGEFIAIFDADFCPRTDFLIETLPYMIETPRVAIVQTPQFFSHRVENNWLANAAGAVQELFYRLIQVNRDSFGGAICVGTNAIYRRSALEPFGGTAPMAYSEDVHTGFQLLSNGWAIKYIPVVLAEGICPDVVRSFFTQQYRWAMGSISLFFSKKFWDAPITKMQRVCYLTGMGFYISTGIGVIVGPLPTLAMLAFFPEKIFWFNLLFAVPSLLYGTLFMRWWMKLPFNLDVLRVRQISYYAHIYALRDFLLGNLEEWKPTGAGGSSARYESFRRLFLWYGAGAVVGTFALIAWRVTDGLSSAQLALTAAFAVFNATVLFPIAKRIY